MLRRETRRPRGAACRPWMQSGYFFRRKSPPIMGTRSPSSSAFMQTAITLDLLTDDISLMC